MKQIVLGIFFSQLLVASAHAEIAHLSGPLTADVVVKVTTNALLATKRVWFTNNALAANCVLTMSKSGLSATTRVHVTKNSLLADQFVMKINGPVTADYRVFVTSNKLLANGSCPEAAALLPAP